jgi:hypothetical protein
MRTVILLAHAALRETRGTSLRLPYMPDTAINNGPHHVQLARRMHIPQDSKRSSSALWVLIDAQRIALRDVARMSSVCVAWASHHATSSCTSAHALQLSMTAVHRTS